MRIGEGFDAHQFETGTPLIIGGVSIPFPKGSKGHSDGDVLFHAIVDALLGALALGDIGSHFPSEDEKWKGADSSHFVSHALSLIKAKGYRVANMDATIILQQPKISPFIEEMRNNISKLLEVDTDSISVKATTTDKLGFIGKGDGLAATAILLLHRVDEY